MAEVALLEVGKSYGPVEAVRGLSLSVSDGEFVVLLGPTGAGKTTTLRLIAGLERPDRGKVVIQGLGSNKCRNCFTSSTSLAIGQPLFPAAKCSESRSDGPWSANQPSI